MTNSIAFEHARVDSGLTKTAIATELGISVQALLNKINNVSEFKGSEIEKLRVLLCLKDDARDRIFFSSNCE